MRKSLKIAFFTIAFLVLGFFVFKKFVLAELLTQLRAQIEETSTQNFSLIKESGEVFYSINDPNSPEKEIYHQLTTTEIELPNGSLVKTQEGTAYVLFPNNSMISIDKNTIIKVVFTPDGISIKQLMGNTWHRIQKLVGSKRYIVETPTAVASVRGTKFAVEVPATKDASNIYVVEGAVEISRTEAADTQTKTTIKSGEFAQILKLATKKEIGLLRVKDLRDNTDFYTQNREKDKKFDQGEFKLQVKTKSIVDFLKNDLLREATPTLPISKLNKATINQQTVCAQVNQAGLQPRLEHMNRLKGLLGQDYDTLLKNLYTLRDVCSDNKIDQLELKKLEAFLN